MNVSSLVPRRFSKRAAFLFAPLFLTGSLDFASLPIFPQTPVLRDFADLPRSAVFAQEEAPEWDALFERRDGWLAADGIYSVELGRDAAENAVKLDAKLDGHLKRWLPARPSHIHVQCTMPLRTTTTSVTRATIGHFQATT